MHESIIIAGFGGQGVLFAGQLLARAALAEGRYVTWIPSYGPEMRGGTANCTTIIADTPIGSPLVRHPSVAIVLNEPSLERFGPLVAPGGLLVFDAALALQPSGRSDIQEIAVPAREMAAELGFPQCANVILLGALVAATEVVQVDSMEHALEQMLAEKKPEAVAANLDALMQGVHFATGRARVPGIQR
jgi:2-oxoglutarate ferredoxin oxidoreductase subunit gamma